MLPFNSPLMCQVLQNDWVRKVLFWNFGTITRGISIRDVLKSVYFNFFRHNAFYVLEVKNVINLYLLLKYYPYDFLAFSMEQLLVS